MRRRFMATKDGSNSRGRRFQYRLGKPRKNTAVPYVRLPWWRRLRAWLWRRAMVWGLA